MKPATSASRKRKLLVTGGSGFLGSQLAVSLREKYEVYFTYHRSEIGIRGAQGFPLDLSSKPDVSNVFRQIRPDAVIHCAAMADVDDCQAHPGQAWKVNVEGTEALAQEAANLKTHFIFISTEAVYEGSRGPYSEESEVKPVNHYAYTKLHAERAVLCSGARAFIARTSFEGWRLIPSGARIGFFEWIIRKLEKGEMFPVFKDRIFTPMSLYNLVSILEEAVSREIEGLYNVEGEDCLSYWDFAKIAAKIFELPAGLMKPALMDEILSTKRPHDTSLNVQRLKGTLRTPLLGADGMIRHFREIRDSKQLALWSSLITIPSVSGKTMTMSRSKAEIH